MKIVALVLMFLVNICFVFTVAKGLIVSNGQRLSSYWNEDLVDHQILAKGTFWTLIAAVIVIEIVVQLKGRSTHDGFSISYMCVAFIVLVTLHFMRRRYTGLSHPRVHTALAIVCFLSFVVMDVIGVRLLQKF